jgi:hypothetical protein
VACGQAIQRNRRFGRALKFFRGTVRLHIERILESRHAFLNF